MRGILAGGAITLVGAVAIYSAARQPQASAPSSAEAPAAIADVRDGDFVSEDAVLPAGFGRECPPALHGECQVIDRRNRAGGEAEAGAIHARRAARDAAGGGPFGVPAPQGRPMFDMLTALSLAQLNVEGLLREPSSARFSGVWRVNVESQGQWMPAYCGRVTGRNGFGGYAHSARFVATPMLAAIDGQAGFDRLYREVCVDLPMVEPVPHF